MARDKETYVVVKRLSMHPPKESGMGYWLRKQFNKNAWAIIVAKRAVPGVQTCRVEVIMDTPTDADVTLFFNINESFNIAGVHRQRFRVVRSGRNRQQFTLEVLQRAR